MGLNLEGRRIVKILKRSPERHVDTDLQELLHTRTAVGETSKYRLSTSSTNMRNASETVIRTIASGLFHVSDYRYHVLNKLSPEEHDLRLLRKAIFPGRYWAVSHAKTGLGLKLLVIKKATLENKNVTFWSTIVPRSFCYDIFFPIYE